MTSDKLIFKPLMSFAFEDAENRKRLELKLQRLNYDLRWMMASPGKWHCGIENLKVRFTEVPNMLLLMLVTFLGLEVPRDFGGDALPWAARTHAEEEALEEDRDFMANKRAAE